MVGKHVHNRLLDGYQDHGVPEFEHSHDDSYRGHSHYIVEDEEIIPAFVLEYWDNMQWERQVSGAQGWTVRPKWPNRLKNIHHPERTCRDRSKLFAEDDAVYTRRKADVPWVTYLDMARRSVQLQMCPTCRFLMDFEEMGRP